MLQLHATRRGSGALADSHCAVQHVEQVDTDNYVAKFTKANIYASGDTPEQALVNWKDALKFKFDHYTSFGDDKLGSGAQSDLAIMRRYIART